MDRARARQRELGVPESLEWIAETSPTVADAARAAGLQVAAHPLLVHRRLVPPRPGPGPFRAAVLDPTRDELGEVVAAVGAGFADTDEVEAQEDARAFRDALSRGLMRMVGAFDQHGAVGGGSHAPRGAVTELTGIAVLPRARGQGAGAAVTALLVADAPRLGADVVFLSAGSERVARLYERLGFERLGTACIAEPPG